MAQGKITPKQQEILDYIKSQILERGFPPAVRDICEAVHLKSTSSVHSHLETLEKNGYIKRDPTKPRAIEILDESFNFHSNGPKMCTQKCHQTSHTLCYTTNHTLAPPF